MKNGLKVLLAAVLLAAIVVLAGGFIWALVSWFLGLPASTQTPVAALIGVVSVPVITYFTSRSLERGRSRENAIREKKTEIYDDLIRELMRMMNLNKADKAMSEQAIVRLFADAIPNLITYGSRKVILAWNDFRKVASINSDDSLVVGFAFENLLKAMRNDLGHATATTAKGELLRMFINDLDEGLEARRKG